ncbi:hypothetical protein JX265_009135 [Neoarthrinium moseri]|uniref:Elongation factor methyltransferase 5 n=1 Tax=Neoarthrinium moseri TaxID=1658444 RepID=A0A9P9WGR3_9PEZI|nr:hypothetical protein JX266_006201 [Neoarthrinium moseri]KAI1862421.1 hypothetical protein JX265_009135 [Neoarthrinium moseri]
MGDFIDEPITLSSHALDALKEFYSERDVHTEKFEQLKADAGEDPDSKQAPLSMAAFREDWQESQFWCLAQYHKGRASTVEDPGGIYAEDYSDETARLLAGQLLKSATEDTTIAVVSAPSVFVALKNLLNEAEAGSPKPKLILLEHDQRFSVFPEFVFYDYNQPTKLPDTLKGSVDCIIIDPPFLNPDCQTKMALTARWLSKPNTEDMRAILVTGERMESLVLKLYKNFGLRTTTFDVVHMGLKNEFYCYANFVDDAWKWKES